MTNRNEGDRPLYVTSDPKQLNNFTGLMVGAVCEGRLWRRGVLGSAALKGEVWFIEWVDPEIPPLMLIRADLQRFKFEVYINSDNKGVTP